MHLKCFEPLFLFVNCGMCLGLGHFNADYVFRGTPMVFCWTEKWTEVSSCLSHFVLTLLKVVH